MDKSAAAIRDASGAGQYSPQSSSIEKLNWKLVASTQTQHQVKGRFLLDVSLDIVDRVRGLHIQGDGLTCQGFDKYLHTAAQPQHQMKGRFLLDVIVRQSTAVLQLL